ncbi:d-importin 7/ranbp7 [Anaeramoeba flamelloides]|uniref:D-importin 7/ranbp7 n=1 Tax=Anaeramoeba flamelloides TaxID=1746091 RepID=A0AAV7YYQ1_9EUKA|nr:d-importin 7/ranbp7 [Anaeramoeba flamelloides]
MSSQLAEALSGTLNPDSNIQQKSYEYLTTECYNTDFFPELLGIVVNNDYGTEIQQAGSIFLKNSMKANWGVPVSQNESEMFPPKVQELLIENIQEAICLSHPLVRTQLLQALLTMLITHYPKNMPGFLETTIECLNSNKIEFQIAGLYTIRMISKRFEFKNLDSREPLLELVDSTFPTIFKICSQSVLDHDWYKTKVCVKIFKSSTQLIIPQSLINSESILDWINLFLKILSTAIEKQVNDDDDLNEEESLLNKTKKWVMGLFNRFFQKYGSNRFSVNGNEKFCEYFRTNLSLIILKEILKNFELYLTSKFYISERVLSTLFDYLKYCIQNETTKEFLNGKMEWIIYDLIIPFLRFNENDENNFSNKPEIYLYREFDDEELYFEVRPATLRLIQTICDFENDESRENLTVALNIIEKLFLSYKENPEDIINIQNKDSAILLLGTLSDELLQEDELLENLEKLLIDNVLTEFNSKYGFLKARSYWVIGKYSKLEWSLDQNLIDQLLENLLISISNEDLVIKVHSIITLGLFLSLSSEDFQSKMEKYIGEIIQALLNLINKVGLEELVITLQRLIENGNQSIKPYSKMIIENLIESFILFFELDEIEGNETDVNCFSAIESLNSISLLIEILENDQESLLEISYPLSPIFTDLITNEAYEYLEYILTIINKLTSRIDPIPDHVFIVIEKLFHAFKGFANDYFSDIILSLNNFLTRCPEKIISLEDGKYVEYLVEFYKLIIEDNNYSNDIVIDACKLGCAILQNLKEINNELIPIFLEYSLKKLLQNPKSNTISVMLNSIISTCCTLNPEKVVSWSLNIEQQNNNQITENDVLNLLFEKWFLMIQRNKIHTINLKRLSILGLASFFRIPLNQYPEQVLSLLPSIFNHLVLLLRQFKLKKSGQKDQKFENQDQEIIEFDNFNQLIKTSEKNRTEIIYGLYKNEKQSNLERLIDNKENEEEDDEEYQSDDDIEECDQIFNFICPVDDVDAFDYVNSIFFKFLKTDSQAFQELFQRLTEKNQQFWLENFKN